MLMDCRKEACLVILDGAPSRQEAALRREVHNFLQQLKSWVNPEGQAVLREEFPDEAEEFRMLILQMASLIESERRCSRR